MRTRKGKPTTMTPERNMLTSAARSSSESTPGSSQRMKRQLPARSPRMAESTPPLRSVRGLSSRMKHSSTAVTKKQAAAARTTGASPNEA